MRRTPTLRHRVTAVLVLAATGLPAACGTPAPQQPAASSTMPGPDRTLRAWAAEYCGVAGDLRRVVEANMPRDRDPRTAAGLPRVEVALRNVDAALTTAVNRLRKLPKLGPPGDALAAGELTFYRKQQRNMAEYRSKVPKVGILYAQPTLILVRVDLGLHQPAMPPDHASGLGRAVATTDACRAS